FLTCNAPPRESRPPSSCGKARWAWAGPGAGTERERLSRDVHLRRAPQRLVERRYLPERSLLVGGGRVEVVEFPAAGDFPVLRAVLLQATLVHELAIQRR